MAEFNNKDFWYTTQHILRDKGIYLSLEQFNRYFVFTNEQLKRDAYGSVADPNGYETEVQITDELLPFKKESDITLSSGIGTLPADYWHKSGMIITSSGVKVWPVTNEEFLDSKTNAVTTPTSDYPIYELLNGQIRVLPDTISQVTFTYLKTGNIPSIVIKTDATKGLEVFDETNSIKPEWNNDKILDMIRIFTAMLSIPLDNAQILGYMEQKVKAEN